MQWETGKRYLISYEAESGQRTERQIDLLGISASHGDATCLRAFCHLRGEERTFRSDRIVSAVLVANSIELPWLASARPVAPTPRPAASPLRPRMGFGEAIQTALCYGVCLVFLAGFLGKIGFFERYASKLPYGATPNYSPTPVPRPRLSPPPKSAVEKGWKLKSVYVPEKAWGQRM